MNFVRQQITSFTSSNAVQEFADWDAATTYTLETDNNNLTNSSVVRFGNYYYRSLTTSNTGNNPEDTINIYWVKYQVSNTYAMIDLSATTQTIVEANDLIVEFTRSTIDTIGVGNVEAQEIIIEHLDSLGAVLSEYTQTVSLSINEDVVDKWTYIYSDYTDKLQRSIKIEINPIGSKIRMTFKKRLSVDRASCGYLIGGESVFMGKTLYDVGYNFRSYAVKETDAFGTLNIVKRNVQDLVDFQTILEDIKLTMTLKSKIKEIYNDIVLFVIDSSEQSDYENMLVFGVIENAGVIINTPGATYMNWSVMESI